MQPTTNNYSNFLAQAAEQMSGYAKEAKETPSLKGELILAQREIVIEVITSGCSDAELVNFLARYNLCQSNSIYEPFNQSDEVKAAFEERKLTHIRQPSSLKEFQKAMKDFLSTDKRTVLNEYAHAFTFSSLNNDRQTVKLLMTDMITDTRIDNTKIYFFLLNNPVDYLLEDATICSLFEAYRGEDLNAFFLNESAAREPVDFDQFAQSWNNLGYLDQLLTLDRLLKKRVPFREIAARLFDIDPKFSFGCMMKSLSSNGRRYDVYGFSEHLFDKKLAFYIPGV